MTMVQPDERGAVSIPPDMLRQIGVLPNAPVTIEIAGTVIVVRPPNSGAPVGIASPAHEIEEYTLERKAELLLNNAVDAADYADVVATVRAMGLDPEQIAHDRPAGV